MLAVRDVSRSIRFYRDRLGFEQVEYPGIPLLRLGNLLLFLVEHSPPTADRPGIALTPHRQDGTSPVNLVLEVDDVHAAYRELSGRGVSFLTAPAQPPWGGWRCFTLDPDGYLIEIEQPS
jgi:catechol 2,3-dioxygenase-like lactoylglutathione lyase family enzyme